MDGLVQDNCVLSQAGFVVLTADAGPGEATMLGGVGNLRTDLAAEFKITQWIGKVP